MMAAVCCSRVRRWSNSRMTFSGGGVEISGRLVGKKKAAGNGSARGAIATRLHLAAGKLVRKAIA